MVNRPKTLRHANTNLYFPGPFYSMRLAGTGRAAPSPSTQYDEPFPFGVYPIQSLRQPKLGLIEPLRLVAPDHLQSMRPAMPIQVEPSPCDEPNLHDSHPTSATIRPKSSPPSRSPMTVLFDSSQVSSLRQSLSSQSQPLHFDQPTRFLPLRLAESIPPMPLHTFSIRQAVTGRNHLGPLNSLQYDMPFPDLLCPVLTTSQIWTIPITLTRPLSSCPS